MDILGGIDYEFPPYESLNVHGSAAGDLPPLPPPRNKPLQVTTSQKHGIVVKADVAGDMLDPTLTDNNSPLVAASPMVGATLMGVAGLVAVLWIVYKRMTNKPTHLHVDNDPLLGP